MPDPTIPNVTPASEFQAQFGGPPSTSDLAAQCKQWEKLCAQLLAEKEKLREELAQIRWEYDACRQTLFHLKCKDYKPDFDEAVGFAHLDDKPTVQEIIEELKKSQEQ